MEAISNTASKIAKDASDAIKNPVQSIKSGGKKAIIVTSIIVGVVVIGVTAVILIHRHLAKGKDASGDGSKKSNGNEVADASTTTTTTTTSTGSSSSTPSGSGSGSGSVKSAVNTTDPTLPNGGKGCGNIQAAHDGNYDYVLCNGVWYTRSKANPKTAKVKGTIPNWKSLAGNVNANATLNAAYPNG